MTREQAKEILMLYRPGSSDQLEPDVAAALKMAESDADLKQWQDAHCAFHDAMRAGFRKIPVPEGLKEQIISERKARTTPPLRRPAVLVGLALAIALVLLWIGISLRPRQDEGFAAFRDHMAKMVQRQYPLMDLETNDVAQIRQFLKLNQGHGDYQVPSGLQKTATTGCAVLSWHEKPVSMICFNSTNAPAARTSDLFLFVIDQRSVTTPPASPQFTQVRRMATWSWSEGGKSYVLAGAGGEEFLRRYE